jgi:D-mannonate dehydratase
MKIHPVQGMSFHEDMQAQGQTDMIKLIVTFHNFANAFKNSSSNMQVLYTTFTLTSN